MKKEEMPQRAQMQWLPLAGMRVADFTWFWAGPLCTMILAQMGAEVIRIESRSAPDLLRSYGPRPPGKSVPGLTGWWLLNNREKLGITLNLKQHKGVEIAKRIVSISDFVVENFIPGTMESFGLGYPVLKEIKPDIIMVSISAFGAVGPRSRWPTQGDILANWSGVTSLSGRPDGPTVLDWLANSDPAGSLFGVAAALSALYYRARTGRGQHIDVSELETITDSMAEGIMEYTMNGTQRQRMRNRDDFMAPHGVYRCKGYDEWVSIAVGSEEEWQAFCQALGNPSWTKEERFGDRPSRWQNQEELDALIQEWTIDRDRFQIADTLQKAGVAAVPSYTAEDLLRDRHLKERQFFYEDVSEFGTTLLHQPLTCRMSKTHGKVGKTAPLIGEDNEYVYGALLGMGRKEIDELIEQKVIY